MSHIVDNCNYSFVYHLTNKFLCYFLLRMSKTDPTWTMQLLTTSIIRFHYRKFTFDFILEIVNDKLSCHNNDSGRSYRDFSISIYFKKWWQKKWYMDQKGSVWLLSVIKTTGRAGRGKNSKFPTMNSSKKNGGISEYNL